MTCASCVNRVEKKLAKLDGVQATVNLPLESAHVMVPAGITDQQITDQVAAAGYKARIKRPQHAMQPRMRTTTTHRRPVEAPTAPKATTKTTWRTAARHEC